MRVDSLAAAAALPGCASRPDSASIRTSPKSWSVSRRDRIIEVGYGSGTDFPQYAALHTDSSFLRLNYGPCSAWGTSIVLLPSLWQGGFYYQGARVEVDCRTEAADLVMSFGGSVSELQAQGQIRLKPPGTSSIAGTVIVRVSGDVRLDCRPGEAFKPVVLSSMHISPDHWDAESAQVDSQSIQIPDRGWLTGSSVQGRRFALTGGTSSWKINAPTIEVATQGAWEIAGWKCDSLNPDDDNLSVWAATDHLLRFWEYEVAAGP
jgi:hypothetical protein